MWKQSTMVKAYLFDAYGKTEYVADFLKYKELARILALPKYLDLNMKEKTHGKSTRSFWH